MTVHELRIGNWYRNKSNQELQIDFFEEAHYIAIYCDPIPLTIDWMLKLGYQYYNGQKAGDMTLDTNCKLDIDFINGGIQIKSHYEPESAYRVLTHIRHVHQLQNLFFALTGEELTVKS